ncbi:MAG: Uma2 family endonuclease [Pseudomonadota bacterium]
MMNVHDPLPTTPDEFLRWNAYREGKREFVRGKVVEMMINVTQKHYRLASRLLGELFAKIENNEWIVGAADFGVKTGETIRYPDVMVHVAGADSDLATNTPLFVCEVLSKSTMHIDLGDKAREYLQIDSLQHYLILALDEPAAWLWSRDDNGKFGEPQLITDREASLGLDGLCISIPVADIYRDIV